MSAPQNSTGGDASEHEISGVVRGHADVVAQWEEAVKKFGCTNLLFSFKPVRGDQGAAAQPEAGTVTGKSSNFFYLCHTNPHTANTANSSNVSAENPSAKNNSSTKK
ncbi:hypothetical protein FPHYL_13368 [Fusarium phyllophilum]|uniref:Uncharacterized protein n=1 Tax=Fusarium phyllophilum TaxID=47803 RepID=A0A8H5ICY2_9HYPO|nr:hypothetical protein FPHYL_13368 [Fusarium phyllophilum]